MRGRPRPALHLPWAPRYCRLRYAGTDASAAVIVDILLTWTCCRGPSVSSRRGIYHGHVVILPSTSSCRGIIVVWSIVPPAENVQIGTVQLATEIQHVHTPGPEIAK